MKITDKEIKDFRKLKGTGMTSAVGEYTPSEFWYALDEIERLRRENAGLKDFVIWMTGCGYDFCQHEYFVKQRDVLLKA